MTTTEPLVSTPVTISERAVQALHNIFQAENVPADHKLRVGVKGGGCSGMSYVLAFDVPTDTDDHFEVNGIPVVMDKRHAIYVLNMHIDFEDGLNARGFTFNNPNATSTCGCGTSFSA